MLTGEVQQASVTAVFGWGISPDYDGTDGTDDGCGEGA